MKIVLAYSGGLDTSVILKWLIETYNAEVIAFCADLGQLEDLTDVADKAKKTGAAKVYIEDLKEKFLLDFCFQALKAGAAYEEKYLLAAPLARPLIIQRMLEIAQEEEAEVIAHGATGKGNDQVRFYTSAIALNPNITVMAPMIDWELKSREEAVDYAKAHGIPLSISGEQPYSIDTNIWGSSIECGKLDDLACKPPEEVYQFTQSPQHSPIEEEVISIEFVRGVPQSLNGIRYNPVELVEMLNNLGGKHGIGRIDILENRVVGIKTRGVYESPAGTILHHAHKELESLVLDRDTLQFKRIVAQRYSELVYNGLWFSPLRNSLDSFIEFTQQNVTGKVELGLFKGFVRVMSRHSGYAMYDNSLSSYGKDDTFEHSAGSGFAYIWSMPLRIARFEKSVESDETR